MLDNQNRSEFLDTVAKNLGRSFRQTPDSAPVPINNLAKTRLADQSLDQLCEAFVAFAETQTVKCVISKPEDLIDNLIELCEGYGQSPVVLTGDERLEELGVTAALKERYNAHVWDPALGEENLIAAEKAKIGVVYAEAALTESGGTVIFSSPERGRSVSLLPESAITIFRKSTLLPRVAQIAERLHKMAQDGERMPSCINLIGGASSTADIELIKVFGVHGPIYAAYLIIEDC